jgi:hypothetical protein
VGIASTLRSWFPIPQNILLSLALRFQIIIQPNHHDPIATISQILIKRFIFLLLFRRVVHSSIAKNSGFCVIVKEIKDPIRFKWNELVKVDPYSLSVNVLIQPMELREE